MSGKFTVLVWFITLAVHSFGEFNLTVVHISDFHSHWFEFDENKHDCSKTESREGKCYGGFARLLTFVRDIRKREKNVVVLSSGEFFLGRSLNALHGWKLANALLPKLELDAMSLSNHDFDNGVFELSAYLYSLEFPVLCANMRARKTSFLHSRVNKSVVIDVNGTEVGIVGYIHRHALKKTKSAASVQFLPEIPDLQEEVGRLEREGVNKIIALGHAGYHTDLEIARHVKGIDIVIGGDSDVMLFVPGHDASESLKTANIHGNYPRVHKQEQENNTELMNRTLVLHIPQHGMYVGVLRATFDDDGKIIHESGEPVLLDSSIPQDEDTLEFLAFAKGALEHIAQHARLPDDSEILGQILGHLDGDPRNCRMQECSLGNFITDAMLHIFTFHYRNESEHTSKYEQWGPIDALVYNSGTMMRSIEPGYVRIQDILKSVNLGGFVRRVYMSGEQLLHFMEHSVKHYDPSGVNAPGAFVQVSGMRVEYDLSKPPGKRVRSLSVRCSDCGDDNTYHPIRAYRTYIIGMPNFLRTGRDGYVDFSDDDEYLEDLGQFDAELVVAYLRKMFYIEPKIDGRIKFYSSSENSNDISGKAPLLFGEPATEKNQVENLVTIPIYVIKDILEMSTNNTKIEVEISDGISTFPNQETYKNERISDVVHNIPEQKNEDASEPAEIVLIEYNVKADVLKNDSIVTKLINVNMTEGNSRQTAQSVQNNKTQSLKENSDNSEVSKSNEGTSSPEDEVKINYNSTVEDLLKVLLKSRSENVSLVLEKLANYSSNVSRISDLLSKVSPAISNTVKKRSVENLVENNENWTSSLESKEYISAIEQALRNLLASNASFPNFNVLEPLSSNSLQSKMIDSGLKVKDSKNMKSQLIEDAPVGNDIGMIFMSILKYTLGVDVMKMLNASNVNSTASDETNN